MKEKKRHRIVPLVYKNINWDEIYAALDKKFKKHHARPIIEYFQKNENQFTLWKKITETCPTEKSRVNEQLRKSGTKYRLCANRRHKRNQIDTTQKWKIGKSIEV